MGGRKCNLDCVVDFELDENINFRDVLMHSKLHIFREKHSIFTIVNPCLNAKTCFRENRK